jgi:hypothetical protein
MAAIVLSAVAQPTVWHDVPSVTLSDETLRQRKARVLAQMRQHGYDTLIVYADKEHGGNFEYLTGFIPRFEEALLVLHREGEAVLVLGNENLKLAAFARLENRAIHAPWFSLPNQPMSNEKVCRSCCRMPVSAAGKGWAWWAGSCLPAALTTVHRCSICPLLSWTRFARPPDSRRWCSMPRHYLSLRMAE